MQEYDSIRGRNMQEHSSSTRRQGTQEHSSSTRRQGTQEHDSGRRRKMQEHGRKHGAGRTVCVCLLLLAGTIILFLLSVSMGTGRLTHAQVLSALLGRSGGQAAAIVRMIRAPRAVLALMSGGALALAGYLLQTFFRNPIAGPYVLGISSGARLALAVAMVAAVSGGKNLSSGKMIVLSFLGAFLATGLILLFSLKIRSMSVLLAAGIMISYICSAVTDFVINISGDSSVISMHGWAQGSFSGASPGEAVLASCIILVSSVCVFALSKPLGAYMNGESYARSLGVNVRVLQLALITLSSLLAGTVTAFAGPVSFVGIATPWLVRGMIRDRRPVSMVPALFLMGALYTMGADLVSRTVIAPDEMALSTVTAFVGVPIVLIMLTGEKTR